MYGQRYLSVAVLLIAAFATGRYGWKLLGFRFSTIFGFFEAGDFCVTIPIKGEIREVVLKTETSE